MKRIVTILLVGMVFTTLCAAQASMRNFRQTGNCTGTLDAKELSIAHPSLTLGTLVKVTNTDTNQVVYATVTNRISASAQRIADLSPDAARQIGIPEGGSVPVLLERAVRPEAEPDPPVIAEKPAERPAAERPAERPAAERPAERPAEPVAERPAAERPAEPVAERPAAERPQPRPLAAKTPARILPRMPESGSATVFRVQAGSYMMPLHAKEAFERLVKAGFHPYYERYEDYIRVVIPGVPAAYIPWISQRLGNLDVTEAWIRPERY
jgi:hypothetical protein